MGVRQRWAEFNDRVERRTRPRRDWAQVHPVQAALFVAAPISLAAWLRLRHSDVSAPARLGAALAVGVVFIGFYRFLLARAIRRDAERDARDQLKPEHGCSPEAG